MHKISDVMTRQVKVVRPDDSVQNAARMMADEDVGSLPVCDGTRLLGIITDRDIAIRAVASGRAVDSPVRSVMTEEIVWCSDDENTQTVMERMGEHQIRRIPVVDKARNLVGIVALGDLAVADEKNVDETLRDISMPA